MSSFASVLTVVKVTHSWSARKKRIDCCELATAYKRDFVVVFIVFNLSQPTIGFCLFVINSYGW